MNSITGDMKHLKYILMVTVVVLLAACSEDNADEQALKPDAALRLAGVTRAVTGEPEYGDVRIFLTHGTTATEGLFKYEGSSWTTQLKLKSGTRIYQLYGYMPDNETFTHSISDFDEDGATLHIQQLPPIADKDYGVVTGVRQATDGNDETPAVRGTFSFSYDSRRENYVNLFLDHLYSHVVFCMRVGEDYNAVRTIKIKRMTLQVTGTSPHPYDVDVTLTKDVGISSLAYNPKTAVAATSELTIRDQEITLTTASTTVCGGYVIPDAALSAGLSLAIAYDIYDKRGNKIAERTATNSLTNPLNGLERGEERTLQIVIDPSYLYDLSLNDPPIVFVKE